jgi:hypothetical protein
MRPAARALRSGMITVFDKSNDMTDGVLGRVQWDDDEKQTHRRGPRRTAPKRSSQMQTSALRIGPIR